MKHLWFLVSRILIPWVSHCLVHYISSKFLAPQTKHNITGIVWFNRYNRTILTHFITVTLISCFGSYKSLLTHCDCSRLEPPSSATAHLHQREFPQLGFIFTLLNLSVYIGSLFQPAKVFWDFILELSLLDFCPCEFDVYILVVNLCLQGTRKQTE